MLAKISFLGEEQCTVIILLEQFSKESNLCIHPHISEYTAVTKESEFWASVLLYSVITLPTSSATVNWKFKKKKKVPNFSIPT